MKACMTFSRTPLEREEKIHLDTVWLNGLLGNKSCVQLPGGQIHQDIGNFETSGSKYQRDEIRFDLDYWGNKWVISITIKWALIMGPSERRVLCSSSQSYKINNSTYCWFTFTQFWQRFNFSIIKFDCLMFVVLSGKKNSVFKNVTNV